MLCRTGSLTSEIATATVMSRRRAIAASSSLIYNHCACSFKPLSTVTLTFVDTAAPGRACSGRCIFMSGLGSASRRTAKPGTDPARLR